jgi:hypothetical protein
MNWVLAAAILTPQGPADAGSVLKCKLERGGKFTVTERQFRVVMDNLTLERIGILIHPTKGVNVRGFMGPKHYWDSWWSKDEILHSVRPEEIKKWQESFGPSPFVQICATFDTKVSRPRKLDYRTWEAVPTMNHPIRDWLLSMRKKNGGPVECIKLICANGRLWLGAVYHTQESE